jgi:glutaredoxin
VLTLLLSGNNIFGKTFKFPPYLQNVTSHSAVVRWAWQESASARLVYGLTTDYSDTANSPAAETHAAEIKDLKPGSRYYYNLVERDNLLLDDPEQHFFYTAPEGKEESLVFAVIGDTRGGRDAFPSDHRNVINSIIKHTIPSFLLHTGDMVDVTAKKSWEEFFSMEAPLLRQCPIYPLRGNSDGSLDNFTLLFSFPGKPGWNSFSYGPVYVIALDVQFNRPDSYYREKIGRQSVQYQWLKEQLSSPQRDACPFTVVMLVAPLFTAGDKDNTLLIESLCPLFEQYGVELVLSGSLHYFSYAVHNDVSYIISGGGGAALNITGKSRSGQVTFSGAVFHHLRCLVHYPALTIEAVDNQGAVFFSHDIISRKVSASPVYEKSKNEPGIVVYVSKECPDCMAFKNRTLPAVLRSLGEPELKVEFRDVDDEDVYNQYLGLESRAGSRKHSFPVVVMGKELLSGDDLKIEALENFIRRSLAGIPEADRPSERFSLTVILIAVLIVSAVAALLQVMIRKPFKRRTLKK